MGTESEDYDPIPALSEAEREELHKIVLSFMDV